MSPNRFTPRGSAQRPAITDRAPPRAADRRPSSLVGLVVAIATNSLWALDFYHVVGGGLWTALDLFLGLVLGPIMGTMSIPARIEFSSRLMPKLLLIMPTLVTMTLGSGFQLARQLGNLAPNYANHDWLVASYIVVGVMAIDRARAARAGEHRGALRAAQAEAQRRADRAADEGLHLHGRRSPG